MAVQKEKKNYDRKVLKIFAPVVAGLVIPVVAYIVYMSYHPLEAQRDGDGALFGFWILNNIVFPILIVLLLIFQWLVILPWWGRIVADFNKKKGKAALILLTICFSIGALFGLLFWKAQFGTERLAISIVFVFFAQLIYWLPNIIVLYVVDKPRIQKPKPRRY